MNEVWFERIERYINDEMEPDEKTAFESELASNKDLKAQYDVQHWLEDEMIHPRKDDAFWKTIEDARAGHLQAPKPAPRVIPLWKRLPFKTAAAVAAILLVVVFVYKGFFYQHQDALQFADSYINKNLAIISQTMSGFPDSLQLGIMAYNAKDYSKALTLFQSLSAGNPANRNAVQYAGYTYLMTKDYEHALLQFDRLASLGGKFNEGKFLQAAALLQRNKENDKEQARQLLQQVVNERAGGWQQAAEWLKAF